MKLNFAINFDTHWTLFDKKCICCYSNIGIHDVFYTRSSFLLHGL